LTDQIENQVMNDIQKKYVLAPKPQAN